MAAFNKYMECTICLSIFTNPKELTCGHVFCKMCLDESIMFNEDGEGLIICALCKQETIIAKNQTTDDLPISLYLKNMASEHNEERLANISKCGTADCDNKFVTMCANCPQYFCNTCKKDHLRHTEHTMAPVCFNKEDSISVSCIKHKTPSTFHCRTDGSFICIYCSKREHASHVYCSIGDCVKNVKTSLENELELQRNVPRNLQKINEDIECSKIEFEKCLKDRKIINILEYIKHLEEEENRLRLQFNGLIEHHRFSYGSKSKVNLESHLLKSDMQLAILKENIVQSIIDNRTQTIVPKKSISLTKNYFKDKDPLGNLTVTSEDISVNQVHHSTTFTFNSSEEKARQKESELLESLCTLMKELNIHEEKYKDLLGFSDTTAISATSVNVNNGRPSTRPKTSVHNNEQKNTNAPTTTPSITMSIQKRQRLENLIREYEQARDKYEYVSKLLWHDKDEEGVWYITENDDSWINVKGPFGWTITTLVVVFTDNVLLLDHCIKGGANPLQVDIGGNNLLHCAAMNENVNIMEWLATRYSDLLRGENKWNGFTPFEEALYYNEHRAIETLSSKLSLEAVMLLKQKLKRQYLYQKFAWDDTT